eukprot:9269251-Ditylum_brightwellii.AAC.1
MSTSDKYFNRSKKRLHSHPQHSLLMLRGGGVFQGNRPTFRKKLTPPPPLPQNKVLATKRTFFRRSMYATCITVVFLWILIGTVTYTYLNSWPPATAFFYAVDAGMSIGFCTDVAETTTRSRGFTVLYILAGASVVAGALALFVEDTLEGASVAITSEYRSMMERKAFERYDTNHDGYLAYEELKKMFRTVGYDVDDENMSLLWDYLDSNKDGLVSESELERAGLFRKDGIEELLQDLTVETTNVMVVERGNSSNGSSKN